MLYGEYDSKRCATRSHILIVSANNIFPYPLAVVGVLLSFQTNYICRMQGEIGIAVDSGQLTANLVPGRSGVLLLLF